MKQTTKTQEEQKNDDLMSIQTTMIDSWMKYQSSLIDQVNQTIMAEEETIIQDDNKPRQSLSDEALLKESYQAAISVSNILENMNNPSPHHYVAILKTWANVCEMARTLNLSKNTIVIGIPQRTQHILNQQSNPSVESYNQVIKAWAYSNEYLRGTMAEQVFQKIPTVPNGESFKYIIRAHVWSRESRSAFVATGHFMRMMRLLEIGKDDMIPTIEDYHILCHAWTNAGDRNAPSKVYTVLEIMDMAYRKGLTTLRPDTQCYRDALITMSRRHNIPDVGDLADETLKEMKEYSMTPDTGCYRSAILAWKHVTMARDTPFPEQAILRAQELLQEMTEAYHRTTIITVRPSTEDYNNVLEALTYSEGSKAFDRAQKLFNTLKSDPSCGPDPLTYKFMLDILYKSRTTEKLNRAMQLLEELREKAIENDTWVESKSSRQHLLDAFAAFIRVCGVGGASKDNDLDDRTKIMTMVLRRLEDLKILGLTPDSGVYQALIEASDHLLPQDTPERQNVLERIFRRACDEGQVNPSVLEAFRSSASAYLYAKLVVAQSIQVDNTKVVPESWIRNVKGYKEGKKVMPLSIHGTYTLTKAAAEYRMRKLQRRANKNMLQGGRLK